MPSIPKYMNKRERPIGNINGINTLFQTSTFYIPGTLFAYRNGSLERKEFLEEIDGTNFRTCEVLDEYDDDFVVIYITYC